MPNKTPTTHGIRCPICDCDQQSTIDTRARRGGIRRRRKCIKCDFRFTTIETITSEAPEPIDFQI